MLSEFGLNIRLEFRLWGESWGKSGDGESQLKESIRVCRVKTLAMLTRWACWVLLRSDTLGLPL